MSLLGFTLGDTLGVMTDAFSVTVGGVARVVDTDRLTIQDRLSAVSTADVYVRGFTPAELTEVRIYNGGTGGICLFGGNAVRAELERITRMGDDPWWKLSCQDYTWQVNRYRRVTGAYTGVGINTALRRILADFTDGGFRVGYCPASLGNVRDLSVTDAPVTTVLDRLAEQAGGFWDVDPDKRVHVFTDPDHLSADAVAIGDATNNFAHPSILRDGTEIATRVVTLGATVRATAYTTAGSTSLAVDDVTPFIGASASTGTALVDGVVVTYSAVASTSGLSYGPGVLTVSALTASVAQGAPVRVRHQEDDSSAQTALATLLGGGLSGIAEARLDLGDASRDELIAAAVALLAKRSASYVSLSYDTYDQIHTDAQQTVKGQLVDVDLTAPVTVNQEMRVQSVTLAARTGGRIAGAALQFNRRVSLGPYYRGLALTSRLENNF